MGGVLRYRAHKELAEMAYAAGQTAQGSNYAAELPLIQATLRSTLWDNARGLYLGATVVDRQHLVPGR